MSPGKGSPATRARQAWNGGKVGAPPASKETPVTGECAVDGCGDLADSPRPAPQMTRVEFPDSREPARWYCPGWCARYGAALAEIRAISVGDAS